MSFLLIHVCFSVGSCSTLLPIFNKVCFCLLSVDLQDLYIFWTRGLRQIHPLMACSCVSSVSCDVFVQRASFLQRRCRCRAAGQGRSGLSRVYKVPTSPSLSCGSFTDAFIHVHADTRIPLNGRQCVRRCATVPTIDLGTSSSPPPPKKTLYLLPVWPSSLKGTFVGVGRRLGTELSDVFLLVFKGAAWLSRAT